MSICLRSFRQAIQRHHLCHRKRNRSMRKVKCLRHCVISPVFNDTTRSWLFPTFIVRPQDVRDFVYNHGLIPDICVKAIMSKHIIHLLKWSHAFKQIRWSKCCGIYCVKRTQRPTSFGCHSIPFDLCLKEIHAFIPDSG